MKKVRSEEGKEVRSEEVKKLRSYTMHGMNLCIFTSAIG